MTIQHSRYRSTALSSADARQIAYHARLWSAYLPPHAERGTLVIAFSFNFHPLNGIMPMTMQPSSLRTWLAPFRQTMPIIRTRALFYLHALSALALIMVVLTIIPTATTDYLVKLLCVAALNVVGMWATKRDLVRLEGSTWWCYRARPCRGDV